MRSRFLLLIGFGLILLFGLNSRMFSSRSNQSARPEVQTPSFVEITAELDSTWQSARTNHHHVTARCIVGRKSWHISGDFMKNAKLDYWLVDTNGIERRTITSGMYLERAKEYITKSLGQSPRSPFLHSFPRIGETFTMFHPSPIGQPFFGGAETVVWLAFCSGSYLKQNGRQIPMPIGDSSRAFGYSDQTAIFDDDFGLPRSVKLYATNGPLVFEYQVTKTTNLFGRNFPLEFRLIQHGQPADGRANLHSKTELIGKVTSIRPGSAPLLPIEIREELGTPANLSSGTESIAPVAINLLRHGSK